MNLWTDLLAHPGWKRLEAQLRERRTEAMEKLLALGRISSDANVSAAAMRVAEIDYFLRTPQEEAAKGKDE